MGKKARSANWTEQEKKVLRTLVLERVERIENKDTSSKSNADKKLAWEEVLACYNYTCSFKRDMTQVLNQWKNMKNRAKKKEFAFRSAKAKTGGVPPPPSPPSEDAMLIEALPLEFHGDSNEYDSDANHIDEESTQEFSPSVVPTSHRQERLLTPVPGQLSKKIYDGCECTVGHDHKLFVLAKQGREAALRREEEVHQRKLKIMSLEEQYLRLQIEKLKST